MIAPAEGRSAEPATLTISEVAGRTGMSVATLRNWETRYGVPRPARSDGGQRRYRESDCRLVDDIVRRRDSGVALASAVRQALEHSGSAGESSIYRALRRTRRDLKVHTLDKGMLLALTWAMEDECCSAAEDAILIGAFQKVRYYESARTRWQSMASTSAQTVAFADFEAPVVRPGGVVEIPFPPSSPLSREWALISDSPDLPVCLLAWERPGQAGRPERKRIFETVWSVTPDVVRQATRIAVDIAGRAVPGLGPRLAPRLAEGAPGPSGDLVRATGVIERTFDYLARDRTA